MTTTDLQVQYAEDLAGQAVRLDLGADQMLCLSQHCHKNSGYGVAVDVYADVLVLLCRKCKRPCIAFRVARKTRAS